MTLTLGNLTEQVGVAALACPLQTGLTEQPQQREHCAFVLGRAAQLSEAPEECALCLPAPLPGLLGSPLVTAAGG